MSPDRAADPAELTPRTATRVRHVGLGSRAWLYLLVGLFIIPAVPAPDRLATLVICNAIVLGMFAWDAHRLLGARVALARKLEPRLHALTETTYEVKLQNLATFPLSIRLRDTPPAFCDVTPVEQRTRLIGGELASLSFTLFARERGRAMLSALYVRMESRSGLAAVSERVPEELELRVLPEATSERKRGQKGPRLDVGNVALRLRRASQGSELESLREYVPSDPLRAIDWKATARRHHPVTRLYQPERSQTLWFVLDASRTMAARLGEGERALKTRFDVALEALLVAADGALRAGDQVGALVYGAEPVLVIPPGRGRAQYRRLLDTLSEVHAAPVRLDVRGLFAELERRAHKRALVVLFTDLENEVHGEALCEHAPLLTRRHLVLCVSLADSITGALADVTTDGGDEPVFQRAAAIDLLRERTELTRKLEKRKVLVLEADEDGLGRATLERYLEIKTRGVL